MVRRGKPLQPTLPALGFAPPALGNKSTPSRSGRAATLRSPQYEKCPARQLQSRINLSGVKAFPYEGKGDRFAVDEVKTASAVAPMRGRGTALAVDEVPFNHYVFVILSKQ